MAAAIREMDPDVMVLTEFRDSPRGRALVGELRRFGFHVLYREGHSSSSGVLAAAKLPLRPLDQTGPAEFPHRWNHFAVGGDSIEFVGIYLNGSSNGTETLSQKQAY